MDTQLQAAFDTAINELNIPNADVRVVTAPKLYARDNIWGDTTARLDLDKGWVYVIRLQDPQPAIIHTLGHELQHVYEFEHNLAAMETLCDAFGHWLEERISGEVHCCSCKRVIPTPEAEEAEHDGEFDGALICDKCYGRLQ